MSNDAYADPFGTQSVTPGMGTFQTMGTYKLLVVIFVVDCSKTMKGDRIGSVNAALQELKYKLTEIKNDNSLELKVAIMSFASNAKWELQLTPVEEVMLNTIHTRPGLTEYGAAFHELNKVLRKEAYMKHTGKVAPPAIMFLTDGEPEDNYQPDLDELLKNPWFMNASRSAVLLGDAIYNESAKDAVRQFVNNAASDIVTAEDSTVIIQKIKLATMHTVAGDPMQDGKKGDDQFGINASVGDGIVTQDGSAGDILGDLGNPFADLGLDDDSLFGGSVQPNDDSDDGGVLSDNDLFGDDILAADSFGGNSDDLTGSIDNPLSDDNDLFNNLI